MSFWTNRGLWLLLKWVFHRTTMPTVFYVALVTDAVVPTKDTNLFSELDEIDAGNGYTAGGIALNPNTTDFPTLTENDGTDRVVMILRELLWTATGGRLPVTGAARYMVMITDEGTVGNRQVMYVADLEDGRFVTADQPLRIQNTEAYFEHAA
jgi:hypothetical protein